MQPGLNFIATFKAKPGKGDAIREALEKMVDPTRAEKGCVNYDLHRSNDETDVFVLYEGWADQAALDAHMETPHFKALMRESEPLVAAHGDDGKPFTAQSLKMVSARA